jgi:hypothetical protein
MTPANADDTDLRPRCLPDMKVGGGDRFYGTVWFGGKYLRVPVSAVV